MARFKRMVSVSEVTDGVLRRADKAGKRAGARAITVWAEVAGPEIARRTKGFALREGGELVVFVDTAAWANQLALMSDELRHRMNTHLGQNPVTSIRFTVSKQVAEEKAWTSLMSDAEEAYAPDRTEPRPLDEIEMAQAQQVVSAVKDPKVREAALRAMVKGLEHAKGERAKTPRRRSKRPPELP